jgi:hypothetical protein
VSTYTENASVYNATQFQKVQVTYKKIVCKYTLIIVNVPSMLLKLSVSMIFKLQNAESKLLLVGLITIVAYEVQEELTKTMQLIYGVPFKAVRKFSSSSF